MKLRTLLTAVLVAAVATPAFATRLFHDVPGNHPYAHAIATAEQDGWFRGYSDGTFKPDQYISANELQTVILRKHPRLTRAQAAAFVIAGEKAITGNPPLPASTTTTTAPPARPGNPPPSAIYDGWWPPIDWQEPTSCMTSTYCVPIRLSDVPDGLKIGWRVVRDNGEQVAFQSPIPMPQNGNYDIPLGKMETKGRMGDNLWIVAEPYSVGLSVFFVTGWDAITENRLVRNGVHCDSYLPCYGEFRFVPVDGAGRCLFDPRPGYGGHAPSACLPKPEGG